MSDMQGRHAKEVKFKSRELTGKGNDRMGRARCRQRVATGRDRQASPGGLPSGKKAVPPCCLPCGVHAQNMSMRFALGRLAKGQRICGLV